MFSQIPDEAQVAPRHRDVFGGCLVLRTAQTTKDPSMQPCIQECFFANVTGRLGIEVHMFSGVGSDLDDMAAQCSDARQQRADFQGNPLARILR